MLKAVTVIGARPQFIKAAPVCRAIKKYNGAHGDVFKEVLVNSGQHYDYLMSKVFFDELRIPEPQYNLEVGSASHGKQTALILDRAEEVILKERPDVVIVYGDTNTTLAGALAASKLHIPVAHIEAGMRSYNKKMPEEINRLLTDHVSTLLFCSSRVSVENLKKEGVTKGVYEAGDVMCDSFLFNIKIAERDSKILATLNLKPKTYYLSTIHRAENTDETDRLKNILNAFKKLDKPVILPLHPRTKKVLSESLKGFDPAPTRIIDPLPYSDMAVAAKNASAILTDSGGLQKEAYFLKVPCVTLRDETEWVETVDSGWNTLTGADENKIVEAIKRITIGKPPSNYREVYGDGRASEKIIDIIVSYASKTV